MENEPDASRLAAWRTFITAHAALIGRIERDMAAAGVIPLTWYDVLIELYEAPERRLRLHELADAVVLSRSGLSRLIDRLEGAGLLRREAAATDRRGAYAVLTDAGIAAMAAAWPIYARGITTYFAHHLTDTEAALLTDALGRTLAGARENR
ncbi:MAG: MarR family transcriptional regulator [Thermomicrobia bacterium]|nr:MarR family transcriptional regulator [Thermomicrobia bacterium]